AGLEGAMDLYGGDLLEGFYDDWALRERERLRLVYLNSLAFLMRHHARRGAFDRSLAWGRRLLQFDPLREEIHREMMRLYAESGQRALALRQYETCREALATELHIHPMEDTRTFYAELAGRDGRVGRMSSRGTGAKLEPLLKAFEQALVALERARDHVHDAVRALQRAVDAPPQR